LIRPVALPDGWILKGVFAGGRDITDKPMEAQEIEEGVRVVISDKAAELSGAVLSTDGKPLDDFTVIAVPADEHLWGGDARFVRAVRAAQDMRFKIDKLPPMDYYVIALHDVESDEWLDPVFLQELRASGLRITLHDREKKSMDLKISR